MIQVTIDARCWWRPNASQEIPVKLIRRIEHAMGPMAAIQPKDHRNGEQSIVGAQWVTDRISIRTPI